jgi:protein-tyrosine phosphatase
MKTMRVRGRDLNLHQSRSGLRTATGVLLALSLMCSSCGERTYPTPDPHIVLEGQSNFRDLGGYKTRDGRSIRWGQVFRSGELPALTPSDLRTLATLGLRTDVNFLVQAEIDKHGPDRLPDGVQEVPLPITGDIGNLALQVHAAIRSGDFSGLPSDLTPKVHAALLTDGKEQYAALLRLALDPKRRPLVFHCSHGVHRTGTAAAILLSALGVPWETVREDYILSNHYRAEETNAALARIRKGVAAKQGLAEGEVDMTNVEAFYVVREHYIDGSLDAALAEHGSMAAYIRDGLGITDEEVRALRAQLLEDPR